MSKILANHPRLSKFVFGLFGAAGMIWLNKAFQGDELFQLITSLLALDTFYTGQTESKLQGAPVFCRKEMVQ